MNDRAKDILLRGAQELGLALSEEHLQQFRLLNGELTKWGRKINLTAIQGDEQTVIKHFLDSLTLLQLVGTEGNLLDIGSGAGFPALPVKIFRPLVSVVTVDAVEKKILFQRQASRVLGLDGFNPLHGRVEALADRFCGHFDWVVSRAFSDLVTFATVAKPLIKPEGKIIAMKGSSGREEADAAEGQLLQKGIIISAIQEFALPVAGDRRSLVVMVLQRTL